MGEQVGTLASIWHKHIWPMMNKVVLEDMQYQNAIERNFALLPHWCSEIGCMVPSNKRNPVLMAPNHPIIRSLFQYTDKGITSGI